MQLTGFKPKVEKIIKKKSSVQEIVETFIILKDIQHIPNNMTALQKKSFYGKLMREAKEVLDAYKVWGGTLDNILRDLSQLDFEAKSKKFNYSIRTLIKPDAKWKFTY